jgi:hypothetical protein
MTDCTMQNTERDLSQMLGELLRQRTTSAKDLARKIDCDPRAAEGYRAGRHLPPLPVFARMAVLWRDLADAILHPNEAVERLEREVADREARLAEAKALLRAVESGVPRPAKGVPARAPAETVERRHGERRRA